MSIICKLARASQAWFCAIYRDLKNATKSNGIYIILHYVKQLPSYQEKSFILKS
jgi:hypothetical protein